MNVNAPDTAQTDVRVALQDLGDADNPDPLLFERVARWRRACGDAEAAVTWQTWSLLPPESEMLDRALSGIWRRLGEPDRAAALLDRHSSPSTAQSWERLAILLEYGNTEVATALQNRLLDHPPSITQAELIELVQLWQLAKCSNQALLLLEPLTTWMERRGEPKSPQLCCLNADLLEKQERFDDAEPWWQHAHALQPLNIWPLMRLGHQALRCQQPATAFHYARQVLKREPDHQHAPELAREALLSLKADRSLALFEGQFQLDETIAPSFNSETNLPEPEFWDHCRSLCLIGFQDASLLQGWCEYLMNVKLKDRDKNSFQLWLIASPDPLWLEHQAAALLKGQPYEFIIRSWPTWDESRHDASDRVLRASELHPLWTSVRN